MLIKLGLEKVVPIDGVGCRPWYLWGPPKLDPPKKDPLIFYFLLDYLAIFYSCLPDARPQAPSTLSAYHILPTIGKRLENNGFARPRTNLLTLMVSVDTSWGVYQDRLVNWASYSATDIPSVCLSLSYSIANFFFLLTRRNLILKASVNSSQVNGGGLATFLPSRSVSYHYLVVPFKLYAVNSTTLSLEHLRGLRA